MNAATLDAIVLAAIIKLAHENDNAVYNTTVHHVFAGKLSQRGIKWSFDRLAHAGHISLVNVAGTPAGTVEVNFVDQSAFEMVAEIAKSHSKVAKVLAGSLPFKDVFEA